MGAMMDADAAARPINLHQTRVRSHQTDINGHMYHGRFLDVFDDARIEMFRRLDYTWADVVQEGWNLVIHRVDCTFHAPAQLDDVLTISVHILGFSRATMSARYKCRRDGVLLAEGQIVYAFVNGSGRPLRVPSRVRQVVHEHDLLALP
jgi:YbgC/YbaW family acyl-CoA thioester hydrolase